MKLVLRILGLSTVITCAALTSAGAALPGTCRTFCSGGGTFTTVTWSTSESQCCSLAGAPCPAGTTPVGAAWQPYNGNWQFCGPAQ